MREAKGARDVPTSFADAQSTWSLKRSVSSQQVTCEIWISHKFWIGDQGREEIADETVSILSEESLSHLNMEFRSIAKMINWNLSGRICQVGTGGLPPL